MKRILFSFFLLFISINSFTQIVYTNNFSGGATGWSLGAGGNFDTWIVNSVYNCSDVTPNQGGGNYLHIYDDLFGEMCAYSGFLGSGSGGTVYAAQTADFSTSGYTSVNVSFDWLCQGQTGPILSSYGFIQYSTNSGLVWNLITSPISQYNGQPTWTNMNFTNTAMGNQPTVRIRFGFTNSGYGTNPAFAIDNIVITGITGGCTNTGGTSNAAPSSICSGNTSVLTVAGSTGAIQWEQSPDGIGSWTNVTGGSGATTSSYTTPALSITTYYRAKLSQVSCPDVYSTVSSVTVNPNVTASVSIMSNPSGPICAGTNVLFTATPTNGGASPAYQWFLNSNPVGTGSTYSNNSLNTGDQVYCTMTSNASCVTGSPATSNTITMTVNTNVPASVSIDANPVGTICSGTNVLFTATPVNGGPSPSYQWFLNSNPVGTGSTYSSTALNNGDQLFCTMTSSESCATGSPATSNTITMSVTPSVAAGVSIGVLPSSTICAGSDVLFTATPTNGGTPGYVWFLNSNPVGSGSTYFNNNLNNGDQVYCTMTSTATCVTGSPATSNTITMTVNSNPVATLTPPGPVDFCNDTSIVLYCGPVGTYLWSDGSTTNNITPSFPGNYCVIVTDGNGCSDTACVLVTINPVPNVSINGNDTICVGDFATLTASGANTYVWSTSQIINPIMVNPGGTTTYTVTGTESVHMCSSTATFTVVALTNTIDNSLSSINSTTLHANQNGASYQWIDCNNGNLPIGGQTGQNFTATSNGNYAVIITQAACSDTSACNSINGVGIDEQHDQEVLIYPNPSNGEFTMKVSVEGIYHIVDVSGKRVQSIILNDINGYTIHIYGLNTGMYFIEGDTHKGLIRNKLIIQ